ncbi:tyrosine-type recombinase/integrase [Prevotella jejuni]
MAIFKAVVRRPRKDGFWQVYIRVGVGVKVGYITTDKYVTSKGLGKGNEITDPYVLQYCSSLIIEYNDKLNRKDTSRWTVRQVVEYLRTADTDLCFSEYARLHIDRMIDRGQQRNARNYQLALQHLERFCGTTKIMFDELTSPTVNRWIQTLELTKRAKEMYPVCMRQVFKAAVIEYNDYDNGLIRIKTNPWTKVKIPAADRTEKLAISPELCREFFSVPLPESKMKSPLPELGRDVAMMILCLAGINTIDLYDLRKEDYQDGRICYRRAKTRKVRRDEAYIEMRVEPILLPLFEKYKAEDNDPYLFNFHTRMTSSDSFNANVNTGLRKVCESMGMPKDEWFSAYTFRHTWGTVAQNDCGATIDEVAFAKNHSNGHAVTRGYIKLDFSPAWELNRKVIDFIFFSTAKSKQGGAHGVDEPKTDTFRIAPKYMI